MTIIQLEYLLAVANCGSFSLAAEHCFVTQPSLSMQVKALEEELGVVLLDRSKKPVIPTEAGDVVLERARETLRAYNNIRESVAELKGETAGKLRLGVIPTIAPFLLPRILPRLRRDWPEPTTGVDKHYGYAFQWFGLSVLVVLLYVWFQLVRRFYLPSRAARIAAPR